MTDIEPLPRQKSSSVYIGRVIVLGLITIISLLLLVFGVLVPKVYGGSYYGVVSGSMAPQLNTGDLITTKAQNVDEINYGDIVTYTVPDPAVSTGHRLIVHRVIGFINDGGHEFLVTKGDANSQADPLVPVENVTGQVMYSIPLVGYFAQLSGNSEVTSVLFFLLLCGTLWYLYRMILSRSKLKLEKSSS